MLKVAEETVNERQATVDQVGALAKAKLRSDLDLSFANVQISQAKLLLLDAQNSAANAMAALNTVLGSERDEQYTLVDETAASPDPAPQDAEALLQSTFAARPDLAALNDNYTAARQFSTAERDLWLPTISALATVGGTPVRADQIQSSWYGAAGQTSTSPSSPISYNACAQRQSCAPTRPGSARTVRPMPVRDLRTAVLNAQNAFQRIGVTQEMLNESNLALDLSQDVQDRRERHCIDPGATCTDAGRDCLCQRPLCLSNSTRCGAVRVGPVTASTLSGLLNLHHKARDRFSPRHQNLV